MACAVGTHLAPALLNLVVCACVVCFVLSHCRASVLIQDTDEEDEAEDLDAAVRDVTRGSLLG